MKTLLAIFLLGLAARSAVAVTMSPEGVTMDNAPAPAVAGPAPGAPPQLPGGLTVNTQGMNMKDIKSLGASSLASAIGSMSQSEQDQVCQGLMNGGMDASTSQTLKNAGVDCVGALRRDPSFKPTGAQAQMVVDDMRSATPPSNWNQSDWAMVFQQMPDAVTASDIRQINSATLVSLVQSGDMANVAGAFQDPSDKRALETQMKSAFGQANTWTNDTLRQMGSLLTNMDRSTLKSIDADQMKAAASGLKDLDFSDDPGKKAAVGNQLIAGLGDNSATWSAEDITNADQYIRNNPTIVGKLSDSALTSSLPDLGARETDARGAAQLGSRIKSMSGYSDPTAIDPTKVSEMGHLLQGVGRSYLGQMSASVITSSLSTLANISFPRADAKAFMDKVKGTPSTYTADDVKGFGHLITGLDSSDLEQIPAAALADSIADIAEKDFDKGQCRSIMKQVLTVGGSTLQNAGSLMSKCVSPKDIENLSIDDLGLNCSSSTAPSFTPDKATAKLIMGKIKERFGPITATNTNYTLTCMRNFGKVAALGMDPSDFENLPDNGDLNSVFEVLAGFESDMDEAQTKAIAKRVRSHLQVDNDAAVMQVTSTIITQVGKFMKHFNDSDLNRFNTSVKPDIALQLGEANMDTMPTADITRMKNFALSNVLRDDTSTVTDRTGATTLDDNDVRDLGNLFRGVESTDIEKMSGTAISSNVNTMQDKIRDKAGMTAVIDRVVAQDSTFLESSDNIIGSSGLVGGMDSTRLNTINQTLLGEAMTDVASELEARDMMDKKRDDAGFSDEISASDQSAMDQNRQQFMQTSFDGYLTSKASSSSNRRKRSTTTITCSDVQVLGSNAVSLTTAQIDTLTSSEFTDCTQTLGAITGWSSAQLTSLANRAKATYGTTVSSWSSSNVQILGTIIAGLSTSDISTLALSSASVLATMGTSTSFSAAQLQAGFSRFLTLARSGTASSVTGDDLISLGNFACGAQTSEISQFSSANYQTAASAIGQLTSCDSSQQAAYATLAKTAYGQPSTWTSSTITTVGTMIGGLTTAEVGALTSTQIASISTTAIAAMPASTFAGFSSSQLSSFTTSQANAVTSAQQNALSADQRSVLFAAGATDKTTSGASGVARVTILMLLPLLALFL